MVCSHSSLLTFIGATLIRHGQDPDGLGQVGHATALGHYVEGAGRSCDKRCEKSSREQNNSRKGAKTQRTAKQTKHFSFALLCVLAPLREIVYSLSRSKPEVY